MVVAVELVPAAAHKARQLASAADVAVTVVEGDFYAVDVAGPLDVVCYWDGFGIGSDDDQRWLLQRIADWLPTGGCALIDVNTPWYWAHVAGQEMHWERVSRRYDVDAEGCRMIDHWWQHSNETETVAQSLRCYSPADLELLLTGIPLHLSTVEPGGAVDHVSGTYREPVPLRETMQYLARLTRR
jgi:hypothetical protein